MYSLLTQTDSELSSNYGCQCNGSRREYTFNSLIFLREALVPWTGLYPNRGEQEREETLHPSGRIAPPSLSEQLKAGKKSAAWRYDDDDDDDFLRAADACPPSYCVL